jgi:hypothetical protein
MPCQEIIDAVEWSKKTTNTMIYPVHAYWSKHFGPVSEDPITSVWDDTVRYARGLVQFVAAPSGHLYGVLDPVWSTNSDGDMVVRPPMDVKVWIYPSGKVDYQQLLDGTPVGHMPPTELLLTCVGDSLLTGVDGNSVVTVGVARGKPFSVQPA